MNIYRYTQRKSRRGVTLVELIIYIALLGLISFLVIGAIVQMARAFVAFQVTQSITNSGNIAMERMAREVRNAKAIKAASSTFDVHPGRLVLFIDDIDTGASTTIDFFVSTSTLWAQVGTDSPEPLLAASTTVDNLVFREITSSTTKAVKTEMTISLTKGTTTRSANFYNTVLLRKTF